MEIPNLILAVPYRIDMLELRNPVIAGVTMTGQKEQGIEEFFSC